MQNEDLRPQIRDFNFKLCRQGAEKGNKELQYKLGVFYYTGEGVNRDYNQAVYWLTKAANQGYADAQTLLGSCYFDGEGVTQNSKQAVFWWTKAANQGEAHAQWALAYYYFMDTQDLKQAEYWSTKIKNNPSADNELKSLAQKMLETLKLLNELNE